MNYRTIYFSSIERLGIVGGMGIAASSKFHYDINKLASKAIPEQEQMQTVLVSFPNIPDRSECILADRGNEIINALNGIIVKIEAFNVSHIVICCYTSHLVVNYLDNCSKAKIVSLLDYTNNILSAITEDIIILCSSASAAFKIFGDSKRHIYPNLHDQEVINDCIIKLKKGDDEYYIFNMLKSILTRYSYKKILLGCTDFYLLSELFLYEYNESFVIDPLKNIKYDLVNNWLQKIERQYGVLEKRTDNNIVDI